MKIAFYCPFKPVDHPNPSGDREIARGIRDFFLEQGAQVLPLSDFRSRLFFRSPLGWARWLRALWKAYLLARRERPDIFFTYHLYYKAPDPIGYLLALWFRRPYYVFEGMYARKARRWGFWVGYLFSRGALSHARLIFSDKTEDASYLKEWFPPQKIIYLPPSVDLSIFGRANRSATRARLGLRLPTIVSVAMLRPDRKTEGVNFLLDCLSDLRLSGCDFQWVHAGDGQCLQEVRTRALALLGDRATFLGRCSSREVADLLGAGEFFAFPGLDEGFGLVYVEAQAAGLPVVAFDNGGIPDAVARGETALLTPVLDRAAYTAALRLLLENAAVREQMGRRARDFAARKFDRQRNYQEMWDLMIGSAREK